MNSSHPTQPDYTFAFNEKNFSDRILKIFILPDLVEHKPGEGSSSVVDLGQKRKHSREEINTRGDDDADDKREEEVIGWMEESPPSGVVMTKNNPLRVRSIHISSPILATKSLFFYKLFLNGTEEQRHVIVQIYESEEAALMDLLKFIYCNTLSTMAPTSLLDVLIAADKFEVASCMSYCSNELQILQMTTESTLLYLDAGTPSDFGFAFDNINFSDRTLWIELAPDLKIGSDDDLYTNSSDSNSFHVRTVHISSPILAAKSRTFYNLFKNGLKSREQRYVTVPIYASDEDALMDLLKFMYTNTLSAAMPITLLDVVMVADKFEVVSCMRYCINLLLHQHMSTETALHILDLPWIMKMDDEVLPLKNAAKRFLVDHFKDMTEFEEELLSLPLSGIQIVLSSDDLQVDSEDVAYDFALKWSRVHYLDLEERWEVWSTYLFHLVRFPYMTLGKLKEVIKCNDFDQELASKHVFEALFYKAESPYQQRSIAAEAENVNRYVERAYNDKPIKALVFETPRQHCVIYLELKREECASLFPAGSLFSQACDLVGQSVFVAACCNMDLQTASHCFGLFVGMEDKGLQEFTVAYKFSARTSPREKYVRVQKGHYTLTNGMVVGRRNLFGVAWTAFLDEDSVYFINGVLYLRVEISFRE